MNNVLHLAQATSDQAAGTLFGLAGGALIIAAVVALIGFLFSLWMFIDALNNPGLETVMKLVWAAVIFFFFPLGAVVYFFVARGSRTTPGATY
jgi:hypothetical protein